MNVNKVFAAGRVGRDPEIRHTANGKVVANFSVASSKKRGEKETTEWFNIVAWEKSAEFASKHLRKGARVLVIGELQTSSYTDRDGNTRYKTEVIAQDIQVIDWQGKEGQERQKSEDAPPAYTPQPFNPEDDIPF